MNVLIDLLALETDSRDRGIGRYTLNLLESMEASRDRSHTMEGTWDGTDLQRLQAARALLAERQLDVKTSVYSYPRTKTLNLIPEEERVAGLLKARFWGSLSADVVIVPSFFEHSELFLPDIAPRLPGEPLRAVIAHDLIPLIFPDHYLRPGLFQTEWYLKKLEQFREFDLFLANSESTRNDLIALLGIDEEKIVVIGAGLDPVFQRGGARIDQKEGDERLWALGIEKPFVLVVGNGDWRKNNLGAFEAFCQLPPSVQSRFQLVFTQAGPDLVARISKASAVVRRNTVILGKVVEDDLILLYSRCSLNFFPSFYEGFGLPILEAMACGAPVLTSSAGAVGEIVHRQEMLFDPHDQDAMGKALEKALTDADFRNLLREGAREHALQFTWEECARKTWEALARLASSEPRRFTDWNPAHDEIVWLARAVEAGAPAALETLEKSLHSIRLADQRRVLVDISDVALNDAKTGIQRVVRCLVLELARLARRVEGLTVQPVRWDDSGFVYANAFASEKLGLVLAGDDLRWTPQPGDTLFMADSSWGQPERFFPTFANLRRVGGFVVALLHDMIPIYHPQYCHEGTPPFFKNWLDKFIPVIDGFLCVSRATQDELVRYLNETRPRGEPRPWVRFSHNGSDFEAEGRPSASPEIAQTIERHRGRPSFLVLGTVEPRKNHAIVLDAFDRIWETNQDAVLYIVGKEGWDVAAFTARLRSHPRRDRSVFWFSQTTDADIHLLMESVHALIQASHAEGFGLPLVEAGSQGVPLILSDLPVFREIVGDQARFFPKDNASALADLIRESMAKGRAPFSHRIPSLTWNDSARNALRILTGVFTPSSEHPRLLVDVSEVVRLGAKGGIQRVVRNFAQGLARHWTARGGLVELIRWSDGGLVYAREFARAELGMGTSGPDDAVEVLEGDIAFFADSSWIRPERFHPFFAQVRALGGSIVGFLHDLIPLTHPETCASGMTEAFGRWIDSFIPEADQILCNSKATQDALSEYIKAHFPHRDVGLGFVHLGCDLESGRTASVSPEGQDLLHELGSTAFALMVGTVEPRKDHSTVLTAFEQLWSRGFSGALVIAGKGGWNVQELVDRIHRHPELGKRLFWLESATDGDLRSLLDRTWALIQASLAEGFGLPIVEAGSLGVPLILSDIPVFREVGGAAAFFVPRDPGSLAPLIDAALRSASPSRNARLPVTTWAESSHILLDNILAGRP